MAEKNIIFKEAEGYLKAQIDNQELKLDVKEIIKQETYILLDQSNIDITLNDNIEFTGIINTPVDSMRYLLRSGLLYVTIQDNSLNTLIETTIQFNDRQFEASIPNTLPAGDYYCNIEYLESKYFLGYHYSIKFKVNKRAIGYKFDKTSYMGYPNQEINVQMYLYDYKTKKPIATNVSYKFNGQEYFGKTDKDGYIIMSITIPDVIKENCKSFKGCLPEHLENEEDEDPQDVWRDIEIPYNTIDTRGWIYQNNQLIQWFDSAYHYFVGDYKIHVVPREGDEEKSDINEERYHMLEINIINDTYETYPISVKIHVMKSPTTIVLEDKIKLEEKTRLMGYVDGAIGRTRYGAIILEVENEPEQIKFCVDDYGNFDYCYDPIQAALNSTNGLDEYIEGKGNTRKININMDFAIDKSEIINIINDNNNGRTYVYDVFEDTQLLATAKITTLKGTEIIPVTEGTICFTIYRQRYDGIWVRNYRYLEEITDDGEAEILFEITKEGKYYIYAEYYGIFEYNNTTSTKQYYNVINDAYTVRFNTKDALDMQFDWSCDITITDDERNGNDRRLLFEFNDDIKTYTQVGSKAIIDDIEFENININNIHKDIKKIRLRLDEPDIEVTQEKG